MVKSKILSSYSNLFHFFGDKKTTFADDQLILAEQVHSNKVEIIENFSPSLVKECDGLVTTQSFFLGIKTADCLPIFFFEDKKKIIAAIHAGWRGLSLGIIPKGLEAIAKLGGDLKRIKVAIGPHIRVCCYRVEKDRLEKFSFPRKTIAQFRFPFWYLNLEKIVLYQLEKSGIRKKNIEISEICTSCNSQFWSFRRDGRRVGRMINIIGKK